MGRCYKKFIFICILITYAFFVNIITTKAEEVCSCFYSYGVFNTVGENSTTTTESLSFYQIDYTSKSATVKRACGHSLTANNLTGSNLISAIKSQCPAPAYDPIDYDNFNVNKKNIVKNCNIKNCDSVKIYYNEKASNGKVLSTVKTNNSVALTAIEKGNFETAVQNAEERDKEANNYNDFNDIDPSLVVASDPNYDEYNNNASTYSCALIPSSIMNFLNNFFFLIQVLGIVLLVVMSLIEFVKALTASDEDGLKGAIKNTYRRIIIAIILLLLPMLVIWVLNIVNNNAYVTDDNGKRIIGANGDPLCKKEYSSINSNSSNNSRNSSNSNSTSNTKATKKPSNINIKINKALLMLDNSHYNVSYIEATLSDKGVYKTKDITWTVSDKSVAKFKKSGNLVSKVNGRKIQIVGLKYGKTKIMAKLPNGKKAVCDLRVITGAYDSSAGAKIGAIPNAYLVKTVWTNKEVASYINNAADFINKYPNKYIEGKEIKIYYRYNPKNPDMDRVYFSDRSYTYPYGRDLNTIIKPKGQLDINGYIFFYSTKNQMAYLLKKDNVGTFKVIKSSIAAAYNAESNFKGYLAGIHTSTENGSSMFFDINPMGANESETMYGNSVHIGSTGFNHRTQGCTTVKKALHDELLKSSYNGVLTRYIKY